MQSAEERHKLLSQLNRDPLSPLATLLKCAVGILAVAVVVAGPWRLQSAGDAGGNSAAGRHSDPQAGKALPRTVAESKRVFDERRQHYEAAWQDGAAGATNGADEGLLARE